MAGRTDDATAARLIGKHALVGLTYVNADGTLRKHVQLHGRITAVDETKITMRLHGSDEEFTLPPDPEWFEPAEPGEYRLRSTGEVVVDPDLLASLTITAHAEDEATNPRQVPRPYVPKDEQA
jgi:RNase P/RNase MRP subunit p29